MGSKKKNAAKSTSVQNSEKTRAPKASHTSNGVRQKRSEASSKKGQSQTSTGMKWVAIILISGVVASVAVFYASPEVQQAVNDLIVRYSEEKTGSVNTNSEQTVNIRETHNSQDPVQGQSTSDSGDRLETGTKAGQKTTNTQSKDDKTEQESLQKEKEGNKNKPETAKDPGKSKSSDTSAQGGSDNSKGESSRDDQGKEEDTAKADSDIPARGSSKMERQKEEDIYSKLDITNTADFRIRKELDEIDATLAQNRVEEALARYEAVLNGSPKSPRALFGKASALDKLSEVRRSNEILELCMDAFKNLLQLEDVPDKLYKKAGRRLAERQQFRGYGRQATKTYEMLTKKFPMDLPLMDELGVSYLMIGHNEDAKTVFRKVLKLHPQDGFAMVHLGFILKTSDNNPVEAVPFLERGIKTKAEGTQDSRFFYHLGDALQRLGNNEKAYKYYSEAASKGLLLSEHQRSLYNVEHLRSHPWWTLSETGHKDELQNLKRHWQQIRDEALGQMNSQSGLFLAEDENLREKGDWKQFTLFQQGRKNKKNCDRMPLTCSLIEKIPDASGCKRGQVKFSVMEPGVHVWPHCGPTNCRIRAHLGLVVPEGPKIRVINETRTWKEGEFLIFDDSFEHEVWHEGTKQRLVLIIDLWHPGLSENEKRSLAPI